MIEPKNGVRMDCRIHYGNPNNNSIKWYKHNRERIPKNYAQFKD